MPNGLYKKIQINEASFQQQYRSFLVNGFAYDPNQRTKAIIIDGKRFPQLNSRIQQLGDTISQNDKQLRQQKQKLIRNKLYTQQLKKKRQEKGNPWAGYGQNFNAEKISQQTALRIKQFQQKRANKNKQVQNQIKQQNDYSTIYYGQQIQDYKGRRYIDPPSGYNKNKTQCYIPKKCVKIWQATRHSGHMCAKFFPKYGHFALVGDIDGQIKLYDTYRQKQLIRSYLGHKKGCRDVNFSQDGKFFLSCSYDNTILQWDTQYGKVMNCIQTTSYPYCVRLNPQFQKHNSFLAGMASKHVLQYDLRTRKVQLSYDQHLNSVNTLTFVDYSRFVSTSDDKKVFLWQFGISVVIKHISQPQMHSITYACMHPYGTYYAGQSADNRVVIYQYKGGTFRGNKKKNFTGHMNTGYTCGVSFSNDGAYIAAGDQRGKLFFYDWKTCKNYMTLQAHDGPTVAVQWHPCDSNQVLTCGWDGLVKLWQ